MNTFIVGALCCLMFCACLLFGLTLEIEKNRTNLQEQCMNIGGSWTAQNYCIKDKDE